MSSSDEICVTFANVAGGRLVDHDKRYVDADRTPVFAAAVAGLRPDLLIITELNCDGDQLERLAAAGMPGRDVHLLRHGWSDSHIPGVRRLGVGIASAYPFHEVGRIDLPDPPFDMLHWDSGAHLDWHPKGFLVARCDFGELGQVDVVGGQIHPIHMAKSADGHGYSYTEGVGRDYGVAMAALLRKELGARGVSRAVIAGDLNMPNPRDFFTHVIDGRELVDGFGDEPPDTTPDGRSIDRIFMTDDLVARGVDVRRVPGADHFPCACRIGSRTQEQGPTPRRLRQQDLARPAAHPRQPGMGKRGLGRG